MSDDILPGEGLIEWRTRRAAELRAEAHVAWTAGDIDDCGDLSGYAYDIERGHADHPDFDLDRAP